MLSLAVCSANFITQLVVLVILAWGVCTYVRLRRQLWNIKRRIVNMELDDIIDDLLEADSGAVAKHDTTYQRRAGPETTHSVGGEDTGTTNKQHRERLAALAAGGRARQYLRKALSVDQVDNMEDEEVEKLYGRYEARLGAAMTKTLGAAALQLYTSVASMFLPIPPEEQPELVAELEADPFVEHAVSSATCEMYHRFGMYLAPVTAALTTLRHCRFGHGAHNMDDTYQDGGRSDGWREWQRLHQFQSRLHRRLSRKTPKKSPQGGQVQLPEKPNKKASWRSSVLPNNPCKQRLLLRRQRP